LLRLQAEHLVRSTGPGPTDTVETYHARIREAVRAGLDGAARQAHHRQLGRVLEAAGDADPETLVMHFQEAGELDPAAGYAVRAADRAAQALAFDRAARLYRLALELRPMAGAEERSLRRRLADALANAGCGPEAATEYLACVGSDPLEALDLRRRAAEHFMLSGHIEQGTEVLRMVLATFGWKLASSPRRALLSLLLHRIRLRLRGYRFRLRPPQHIRPEQRLRLATLRTAFVSLSLVDNLQAAAFCARYLILALRTGDRTFLADAFLYEAAVLAWQPAQRHRTARLQHLAQVLAKDVADPAFPSRSNALLACQGIIEGRWLSALAHYEEVAVRFGTAAALPPTEHTIATVYGLMALCYLGRVRELAQRLAALTREAAGRGDVAAQTTWRLFGNLVWLAADNVDGARRDLHEAMAQWPVRGFHLRHYQSLFAEVQIDLYRRDAGRAWDRLQSHWPALASSGFLRLQTIRIEMVELHGRCALAATRGATRALLRQVEHDARQIEREHMAWSDPLAQLLRAQVAVLRGDRRSSAGFLAAANGFDAADMALRAQATRRCLGRLLGGSQGQSLVDAADHWMRGQDIHNPERMTGMLVPGLL
jgi:hypothetical protein